MPAAELTAVYDVRTRGATGDGKTLDTAAIQKTIDAAAAAGGGVVHFPAGDFLSGTLTLRSRVTLHLSPGAVLRGSARVGDYDPKHLIFASGVTDIGIEGAGAIDGQGDSFFDRDWKPLARPSPLIEIRDSQGIRIQDLTIRKAPAWTIHTKNCEDVKIRAISIRNNLRAINSDGIDLDSTRNAIVSDCRIEAGDDCIVLKTTNRGGPAGPTENVAITNCVLASSASALKLGTESYGDFRHCVFSNCVIRDSRTGIALLANDGGIMEDIRFQNIVMTTRPKWGQGVEWPIVVDVDKRTNESRPSRIRDVAFSDVTVYTRGRILATGTPENPIERLGFRNLLLRIEGYEKIEGVKEMRGGAKTTAAGIPDYGPTPAAMICAYIKGLSLDGITVAWPAAGGAEAAPPDRAAIFGDHLEDAVISGFQGGASTAGARPIRITNSKDIRQ